MSFLKKMTSIFKPTPSWDDFAKLWQQLSESPADYSFHLAVNAPNIFTQGLAPHPPARLLELKSKSSALQFFQTAPTASEKYQWNEAASALIRSSLEAAGRLLRSNESQQALGSSDEARAIEWMRVSFEVLKKAIASCPIEADKSDHFFSQSVLFKREAEQLELRLIAFNLDIWLQLAPDVPLALTIYNHKDGVAQAPALKAQLQTQGPAALEAIAQIFVASKEHFYWRV